MTDETTAAPRGTTMKTVGAWLLLGMLALAFGLSFGLPSDAITCGVEPLAKTYGTNVVDEDFQYEFRAISLTTRIPEDPKMQEMLGLREEVLDAIVERRVLGEIGRRMGLVADLRDAEDLTADGHLIVLGKTWDWLAGQAFNYAAFERNWLPRFGVGERRYLEYQREEVLARTVRDVLASVITVSEAEVRSAYDQRQNQLSLRYARFEAGRFADLVDPSRADLDKYVAEHKDELVKQFESQGTRFLKLPKQIRLRFIEVEKPQPPAVDADKATQQQHATDLAAARAKIDAALAKLQAGEDFRAVARATSEDADTARRGGDYGWVTLEGTGTGLDPVVDEAARKLEVGARSEVVESDEAFYIVKVEGQREGDVPQDEAILDLAEEALARERGKALAKQAAAEALQALKDGATMTQLFRSPDALGGPAAGGIDQLEIPTDPPKAPKPDDKPELRVTGLFSKEKPIPGLGVNPEITKAAWAADPKAEFIDQVFETPDGFILAAVERKETATDEGFAAARAALYRELSEAKAAKVTARYAYHTCLGDKARGDIVPYSERVSRMMTYDTKEAFDEKGNRVLRPYVMCDRVGNRGGMLNLAALTGGGGR
ncbi:PPIC-type PPIASE domain-containing protein [Nannocystis exedens]|uniref:Periplasmic chaperone PpiD n=1 Tax=Nannocystis exedens TaxID=54 RepID=A0A1I2DNV6_9BACT|nr:peptidylprolyl isomerase [Nannocystis exedens]PCC69034.1 peptidyl-prolyl cis-trans isomerase [Nannocystis exedens]SFE81953.1 PPIC-type PPIASE domain-containing protein [Nannocystis exedens]